MKFNDSAVAPIMAIDFDGTINIDESNKYPECGRPRLWSSRVTNFMHELGIKIVIWTSRDVAYNQEERRMYDDLTPMLEFLDENDIYYDAINKSVQYAPFYYNGRKVYAHMYVDDRGYGWDGDEAGENNVLIHVLTQFLHKVCQFSNRSANITASYCMNGQKPEEWMIDGIKNWKSTDQSLMCRR